MSRILIVGQGNIGTFMGATLKASHDVTHYVNHAWETEEDVKLRFNDRREGKYKLGSDKSYQYKLTNELSEVKDYNYVIIPVNHNEFQSVLIKLLPYLHSNQTLILMGNIWNDFEWIKKNISIPFIYAFPNFGGAIVNNELHGWLTGKFTIGITNKKYKRNLKAVKLLLRKSGFRIKNQSDMKGWLTTHFAYNAGMLLEAANKNGFRSMTKSWKSMKNMFLLIKECMIVANGLGVETKKFGEGKELGLPIWWNVLKTYLVFLIPGMAKSADAGKNIQQWRSYAEKIYDTGVKLNIQMPLLELNLLKNSKNE